MLRVVKNDGLIMFDIQNRNHPIHVKIMKEQLRRQNLTFMKYLLG